MKTKLLIVVVSCSCFFIGCNKGENKKTLDTELIELKNEKSFAPPGEQKPIPVSNDQNNTDSLIALPTPKTTATIDWDKKIIKTATLKLEVKDFKNYNDALHKTIKQFGGYIAQEEQNISEEKTENVISIKVPVDQFETMMNELPGNDVKLIERKITTEDVTGEVVDTKSRLEAKKQTRLKYLDFLKQSKNMEEVLQVQTEINGIQEEIESASGRVNYLSHQAAYSTINLTFYQPVIGFKAIDVSPSFLTRVGNAFKTGGNWILDLIVGLMSVWPLLLIIFGGYFFIKRFRPAKAIAENKVHE